VRDFYFFGRTQSSCANAHPTSMIRYGAGLRSIDQRVGDRRQQDICFAADGPSDDRRGSVPVAIWSVFCRGLLGGPCCGNSFWVAFAVELRSPKPKGP